MTKKLLLAASAVAAMAFASGADAGSIHQVTVKGQQNPPAGASPAGSVNLRATAGVSNLLPYTIASERIVTQANPLIGGIDVATRFSPGIAATGGAPITRATGAGVWTVVYTIAGGQFLTQVPTITVQGSVNGGNTKDLSAAGADHEGVSATGALQQDGSVRVVITKVAGAGGNAADTVVIQGLTITTDLGVSSQVPISIAQRSVVGTDTSTAAPFDSISSTEIVQFKPLLRDVVSFPAELTAALLDYTSFLPVTNPVTRSGVLAQAVQLRSNSTTAFAGGSFNRDLEGRTVVAADIINSASLVVNGTGTPLSRIQPSLTGANFSYGASSATATTARFNNVNFADLSTGGYTFRVSNPTSNLVSFDESVFTGSVELAYNSNYTGPASLTASNGWTNAPANGYSALGQIKLDGTIFTAPWVALNAPMNEANLRIANNGSTDTGAVLVSLRASTNTPATAAIQNNRVQIASSIPAGGVLQITGPELARLLGTTVQNGDLRVIVQADPATLTAKLRVRNFANQSTFEQSLYRVNGQ